MCSSSSADCPSCPSASRRDFVRQLATSLGAFSAFAILAAPTGALESLTISATATDGQKRSYAIPPTDGVQVDKDAEVILTRQQKLVWAFALSCPHQNTALRWSARDQRFQCPKHKSRYRPDGAFIEGRATRAMDRYSISLVGSEVVVDLATLHRQDEDPAGWNVAVVTLP